LNEQKVTGANYVLTFYNDVQELTNTTAQYGNILLDIRQKYGSELKGLSDLEKQQVANTCQTLRFFSVRAYIGLMGIYRAVKKEIPQGVTDAYALIKTQYTPALEAVEAYTIEINSALVDDVIKSLLESSQELVNSVYGNSLNTLTG
jgi:hypothetical protein